MTHFRSQICQVCNNHGRPCTLFITAKQELSNVFFRPTFVPSPLSFNIKIFFDFFLSYWNYFYGMRMVRKRTMMRAMRRRTGMKGEEEPEEKTRISQKETRTRRRMWLLPRRSPLKSSSEQRDQRERCPRRMH